VKRLKKIIQTGVLTSMLAIGVARAENPEDFVVYGSPEARHQEYVQRGYFKAPESEKLGFQIYLNQTNSVTIARLEQAISRLPPAIRKSLKEVRINNKDEESNNSNVGGRGGLDGGLAIFYHGGLTNGNFFHECGHVWENSLSNENRERFLARWNAIAKFNYGNHNTEENDLTKWRSGEKIERWKALGKKVETLYPVLEKEKKDLFLIRESLENDSPADSQYLTRVNTFNTRAEAFNRKSQEYSSAIQEYNTILASFHEPREGVFSAYGSIKVGEDIAEAWKTMLHNPQKAKVLMKSPETRYAQKMHLLAQEAGINLEDILK